MIPPESCAPTPTVGAAQCPGCGASRAPGRLRKMAADGGCVVAQETSRALQPGDGGRELVEDLQGPLAVRHGRAWRRLQGRSARALRH